MDAHEHEWELDFESVGPVATWRCECGAAVDGDTAPDGTTFDQASDAYHHALDAAGFS